MKKQTLSFLAGLVLIGMLTITPFAQTTSTAQCEINRTCVIGPPSPRPEPKPEDPRDKRPSGTTGTSRYATNDRASVDAFWLISTLKIFNLL